jgi:hypothetical protein
MTERILSPGDAKPHLITLAKSCMAGGANAYEALNVLQTALDHIKAEPGKFLAPKPQLPEGHETALAEALG